MDLRDIIDLRDFIDKRSGVDIAKMSSVVDPPTFVSATTNEAGTLVTVTFSKTMADPTGYHAQFAVNDGASNAVTACVLNATTTKIDLTLTNAIDNGDTVTVAYTAGDVTSADTGILATFGAESVSNIVPASPVNYTITSLKSLNQNDAQTTNLSIATIDSTHFAVAYTDVSSYGWIKTFSVDGSYEITEIDALEYDEVNGTEASIVLLDSTHIALAYTGTDTDGYIKIISFDGNCDNLATVTTLEHDEAFSDDNSLVKIDATHLALAYSATSYYGTIKTFSIDESYNVTEVDALSHYSGTVVRSSLVLIDSTHLGLAYSESVGDDGWIKTFSFDGNYDNITEIASLEHETTDSTWTSLVLMDSTHFMLAYAGSGTDGYIKTFSFDGNYQNITEIDSLEHDAGNGEFNSLVNINSTHSILAYQGTDDDGFLKTFSVDGAFDNITQVDSEEFDAASAIWCSVCALDSFHYVVAYWNATDDDGLIKTFSID